MGVAFDSSVAVGVENDFDVGGGCLFVVLGVELTLELIGDFDENARENEFDGNEVDFD